MAFRWRTGAELQSVVAQVDFTAVRTNAPVIETSLQRSGLAAYRIANAAAAEGFTYIFTAAQGNYFSRVYLKLVALPTLTSTLGGFSAGTNNKVTIRVTSGGALQLFNAEDNAQVGSDSSALSTGVWYRIEMNVNTTTLNATTVEAKIDGAAAFASGTIDLAVNPTSFGCFMLTGDLTLDFIVDDIALNDDSGSFQNTYPGECKGIFHLYPNGNGDNSAWTGSDADSTDNYLLVDEFPPDDATTYVQSNTSGQIDDYNIDATPAAMDSSDEVALVAQGIRAAVSDATAGDPDVTLRITMGGTTEESASLDVNSTTYTSPTRNVSPALYELILYNMPGVSTTGITKSDLDAAQIGVRESATDTHFVRISTTWLLVEHKAGAGGRTTKNTDPRPLGIFSGMSRTMINPP